MLEVVLNASEGRDPERLRSLAAAAGGDLLDLHRDGDHHRCVLTLLGEGAPRRVAARAVDLLDLRSHTGVHPRLGVVDVVPFVPLAGTALAEAISARNAFAEWMADTLAVPVFLYGPERSLPDVRRRAFRDLSPDLGPSAAHPTAGATCVGARPLLVAYNIWLDGLDLSAAKAIASSIRRPELRALGLAVGDHVQVSMNLVDPSVVGPEEAYRLVQDRVAVTKGSILEAELVGLLPRSILLRSAASEWTRLGLSREQTIEARLETIGAG